MEFTLATRLHTAVPDPKSNNNSQTLDWSTPKKSFLDFFLPLEIMKFPINVMGKKHSTPKRSSLEAESTNNTLNSLHTAQAADNEGAGQPAPLHTTSTPHIICGPETTEVNNNLPNADPCQVTRCPEDEDNDQPDLPDGDNLKRACSTVVQGQRSRSNSQIDDSGFNSSASDDKDDDSYECDDESEVSRQPSVVLPRKVLSDSQLELFKEKSFPCSESLDLTKRLDGSAMVLPKEMKQHQHACRKTQKEHHLTNGSVRTSHRRRRARADQNNNDLSPKPLQTYLKRSPVHFQDCFQKNGIFTLIACIMYTVLLAVLFGGMGVIVTLAKSVIGKEDLNDLKDHIQAKRRRRPVVASG